uniref:Uncharacterized protein n=1 Tax=Brassica oleracea var. oleracea TaxID=109376 RepID=A0A0D3ECW5_BRAOL
MVNRASSSSSRERAIKDLSTAIDIFSLRLETLDFLKTLFFSPTQNKKKKNKVGRNTLKDLRSEHKIVIKERKHSDIIRNVFELPTTPLR